MVKRARDQLLLKPDASARGFHLRYEDHEIELPDGRVVMLSPLQTDLMHLFLSRIGTYVGTRDFASEVWGIQVSELSSKVQAVVAFRIEVTRLRRKIGYDWIKTNRGTTSYMLLDLLPGPGCFQDWDVLKPYKELIGQCEAGKGGVIAADDELDIGMHRKLLKLAASSVGAKLRYFKSGDSKIEFIVKEKCDIT